MKIAKFRQRLTKLNRPVDVKRAKISLWFSVFFGEDTGVFFGVASTKSSNIAGIPVQTILWVILWVILKRLVGFWLDFLALKPLSHVVRDQVWLTFLPSSSFVQSSRQALLILVLWYRKWPPSVSLVPTAISYAGCAMLYNEE